jgi:hypothetical protein
VALPMIALLLHLSLSATLRREERAFLAFIRAHQLAYVGAEYEQRLEVFVSNLRRVREFNSQRQSFTLGLTRQACLTPSEYRSLPPGSLRSPPRQRTRPTPRTGATAMPLFPSRTRACARAGA